jgi:Outer membrane lipoprotein-sorting protein
MLRVIPVLVGIFLVSAAGAAQEAQLSQAWLQAYEAPLEAKHQSPEEKQGLRIYETQYLMDKGWGSLEVGLDMRLIDAAGRESRRQVIERKTEETEQPNKTIGIFLQPADVRGTIMLTFERSYDSDEQWLFLPAYKRTKKINAANKSGSFLGTEFSWEDISTSELTKYHYRYLRDEGNTWVVERVPVYEFSGYSRELTWVNKDNYQTIKVEYYDRKDTLLKTLTLDHWQKYLDRYWRPLRMEMTNHVNGKKTIMVLSDYRMNMGLDKKMFSSLVLDDIPLPEPIAAAQ